MASGLKAKLAAISAQAGAVPRPEPPARQGMTRALHRQRADARLMQLDDAALCRMGLIGPWPGIERALFLDTETTGLSRGAGTIVFMLGIGYVREGELVVEQLLLGDYPDEPLMLKELRERLPDFDVIVSFNGNAFDLPMLESRAVMQRMPPLFSGKQLLDLMHPSKRLWRRRLGSCRLSALEEHVLCQGRENDLPGSEAPARFFEYLKSGDMALLDEVLLHNKLDVISLMSLLIRLDEAYASPARQMELIDLFSMGKAMERLSERELAEQCYQMASRPRTARSARDLMDERYQAEASMSLSMMRKRAGDFRQAEHLWLALSRRGQMGALPHIELSKLYEHRTRDFARALECAKGALALADTAAERAAAERRIERLQRKIAAQAAALEG